MNWTVKSYSKTNLQALFPQFSYAIAPELYTVVYAFEIIEQPDSNDIHAEKPLDFILQCKTDDLCSVFSEFSDKLTYFGSFHHYETAECVLCDCHLMELYFTAPQELSTETVDN